MRTFIDSHVHIQPWSMMKSEIRERMSRSRPDMEVIRSVMDSPVDFLRHIDREGVEKAALINYVSPHIMGFTDEVNEFVSRFCSQDTNRLLAFGSIDPRRKNGLEARIDELLFKLALRGIKIH